MSRNPEEPHSLSESPRTTPWVPFLVYTLAVLFIAAAVASALLSAV